MVGSGEAPGAPSLTRMPEAPRPRPGQRAVLVVEDDQALASMLGDALANEGYAVSLLDLLDPDAVRAAVGRVEPDCVLLDGEGIRGYGESWDTAAALRARARPVPVVMLTANGPAVEEAREGTSDRSRAAAFAGAIGKPFVLDALLDAVAAAVGAGHPFEESGVAERARTAALAAKLRDAGAADVHTSARREWATFQGPDGALRILYWSQRDGVYYALRQADEGGTMQQIGRFHNLDAAVALALGSPGADPLDGRPGLTPLDY